MRKIAILSVCMIFVFNVSLGMRPSEPGKQPNVIPPPEIPPEILDIAGALRTCFGLPTLQKTTLSDEQILGLLFTSFDAKLAIDIFSHANSGISIGKIHDYAIKNKNICIKKELQTLLYNKEMSGQIKSFMAKQLKWALEKKDPSAVAGCLELYLYDEEFLQKILTQKYSQEIESMIGENLEIHCIKNKLAKGQLDENEKNMVSILPWLVARDDATTLAKILTSKNNTEFEKCSSKTLLDVAADNDSADVIVPILKFKGLLSNSDTKNYFKVAQQQGSTKFMEQLGDYVITQRILTSPMSPPKTSKKFFFKKPSIASLEHALRQTEDGADLSYEQRYKQAKEMHSDLFNKKVEPKVLPIELVRNIQSFVGIMNLKLEHKKTC
jgi:hypothetical protein